MAQVKIHATLPNGYQQGKGYKVKVAWLHEWLEKIQREYPQQTWKLQRVKQSHYGRYGIYETNNWFIVEIVE
jgi:hypothetical protein